MKKVSYFLNSVMEGLKRTCVAKALAVFAVASVTTSSFAQTTETTPGIKGVEDFVGLTYQEVRDAAVAEDTYPTDDMSKVLFFYNVKTGKFLNVGGYWGTNASLHDYGRSMWVNVSGSVFHFAMDMNTNLGKHLGYVYKSSNKDDLGVFVDRKILGEGDVNKVSSENWVIVPIENDDKNTFKIYTEVASTTSTSSYDNYYLSANPDYNGTNSGTTSSCGAYTSPKEGYDTWRIFTYKQIYEAQRRSVDNMTNALELSFRLKCPGFERGDNNIVKWNTYNFVSKTQNEAGFAKFGLEKLYCTSAKWGDGEAYDVNNLSSESPYEFNGSTYTERDNYRRNLAQYFCSSITGKCGMVYQNIDITLPGTYVIECKGYSNTTKAKLFAGVLDPGKPNYMVSGTMNKTVFNQVSNIPQFGIK